VRGVIVTGPADLSLPPTQVVILTGEPDAPAPVALHRELG